MNSLILISPSKGSGFQPILSCKLEAVSPFLALDDLGHRVRGRS
ncbi:MULTISPECIES: hypothetical protein [unclassified Microcoleus]|nr:MULTISPECIES: hypothetical protein [unclassified Microcoleus]